MNTESNSPDPIDAPAPGKPKEKNGAPSAKGAPPAAKPTAAAADRADRRGDERAQHVDAFEKRQERPGDAGLANEARPGLGTRADEAEPKPAPGAHRPDRREPRAPEAAKKFQPPRPDPQEQGADSLAQEEQRSTGVSGHSSGT